MTLSRKASIQGLRDLADLLERCPEVPAPIDVVVSVREGTDAESTARLAMAAQRVTALGYRLLLHSGANSTLLFKLPGGLVYEAYRIPTDHKKAVA